MPDPAFPMAVGLDPRKRCVLPDYKTGEMVRSRGCEQWQTAQMRMFEQQEAPVRASPQKNRPLLQTFFQTFLSAFLTFLPPPGHAQKRARPHSACTCTRTAYF